MATLETPVGDQGLRYVRERPILGAGIVLVAGLANVSGAVVLIATTWSTITDGGALVVTTYLVSVLYGIGSVILSWVLLAGVFHSLSSVLGGEGPFRSTLSVTAVGYLPIACIGVLRGAAIFVASQRATVPESPASLGQFANEVTTGPLFAVITLVSIGFALLSGLLWRRGLASERLIEPSDATKTVAGPLLIWIGWELYPYVTGVL